MDDFEFVERKLIVEISNNTANTTQAPGPGTERVSENVTLMYSERETETIKEIFTFLVTKQPL